MAPTYLNLDSFPPYTPVARDQNCCCHISDYLLKLFEAYEVNNGQDLFIPPLLNLAQFFKVTHLDVHDAFQLLRKKGYDYQLGGLDNAIHFWYLQQNVLEKNV